MNIFNQLFNKPKVTKDDSLFYGKHIIFKKGSLAMHPGEEPPVITTMDTLTSPCLFGKFNERSEDLEYCGHGLQIPLDLAPSVFICPYCFSLMFIDNVNNSARYKDADLTWRPNNAWTIFGYTTYPASEDRRELHEKIRNFTSGGAVLVATRITPEVERMFGISEGKYGVMPLGFTKKELDSLLVTQSEIASFIIQKALDARENSRHRETLGLIQRALAIYPESEKGRSLLNQYRETNKQATKKVRVANRNTVFAAIFHTLLEKGCFVTNPAILLAYAKPTKKGKTIDITDGLFKKDKDLINMLFDILDSIPPPSLDMPNKMQNYQANMKKLDSISPKASQVFLEVMKNPIYLRFNWPADFIIADENSRGWNFVSREAIYDEETPSFLMGIDYIFVR
ncbi:MAG: hypothetical protein HC875_38735 [Anaerolineales bacterium]|nr:hypothetical protein [Anaerolineales bacterium]